MKLRIVPLIKMIRRTTIGKSGNMAAYIPQNYVSSTNHIKTYGLSLTGKNKIEMIKLPLPF